MLLTDEYQVIVEGFADVSRDFIETAVPVVHDSVFTIALGKSYEVGLTALIVKSHDGADETLKPRSSEQVYVVELRADRMDTTVINDVSRSILGIRLGIWLNRIARDPHLE